MFWSLTVKPGDTVAQTCYMNLVVSNAVLGEGAKKGERTFLKVKYPISMNEDGEMVYEEAVLCTLSIGGQENALLNAHFDEGDDIQFLVDGNATVYLSGNFIDPEFGDSDDEDPRIALYESLSPEERELYEKMSPEEREEFEAAMLEESDDEDFDSDDADSDEEDDEEDDEDDDEESEEEEMLAAKAAAASVGQKRADKKADAPANKRQKTETPKKEAKTPKKEDKTPKKEAKTPKKEDKTPKKEAKTPKKEDKTPKKEAPKTPQGKGDAKRPDTPTVKKLAGGLRVVDLADGKGKEARKGANVSVAYIGRLSKSKKVFDKGKNFSFRLGAGEVIKGWDIGVAGMKVGGKRKLIVPANMAYGARGAPPDIPPNAELEFDVILHKC